MGLFYVQYEDVIWLFVHAKWQVTHFNVIHPTPCKESYLDYS